MPDTTPMPKEMANTFSQKSYRCRQRISPVRSQRHSRNISQFARPIDSAGKMMWNEITNPNWIRESSGASIRSGLPAIGTPEAPRQGRDSTLVRPMMPEAGMPEPAARF